MTCFHRWFASGVATASIILLSNASSAQVITTDEWKHGTTLNVFGGAATASSDTGRVLGTALGWKISRLAAIEGSASWFDRGRGTDAFAADLKAQLALTGPHLTIPFVFAGAGLYRASFAGGGEPVPAFYSARMNSRSLVTSSTFTDPSFVFGGGLNLYATSHVAVRPEVQETIVRRDSRSYFVTSVVVHLAYHFEGRPGG